MCVTGELARVLCPSEHFAAERTRTRDSERERKRAGASVAALRGRQRKKRRGEWKGVQTGDEAEGTGGEGLSPTGAHSLWKLGHRSDSSHRRENCHSNR